MLVAALLLPLALANGAASPARALGRSRLARPAVRMAVDENTPTSYADYMKRKKAEELGEQLKDGAIVYDANDDWQRSEGEGGVSTMSQGFASTDTPDYAPDADDPRSKIAFNEGIMGSQKKREVHNHDPGVKAALEVNPEMIAGIEIDGNRRVEFVRPAERWPGDPAAALSAEFDLGRVSKLGTAFEFDVEPACMTFEDFYAGFTAESADCFRVEPTFGRMDRKNGEVTTFKVFCKPTGGQKGPVQATLCVILPDDGEQWTFVFKAEAS
jgi:hypothetical protein